MFPDDMVEQRRKLMVMLAAVVKGLGNLEQVFAGRQRIGKAACQLRCEAAALSGGRRRVVVTHRGHRCFGWGKAVGQLIAEEGRYEPGAATRCSSNWGRACQAR
jgi:hypothetical protein